MNQRPNVILINCDDLGYGDLGCYGSEKHDTPHIDRLAAEGLRLTSFYMAAPLCSPSRAAMLTGCYPARIGFDRFTNGGVLFPGDAEGLHEDEHTIAQMLKERGYATKIVGKWHCGDQPEFLPTRFGFDSYYGLPYSNDMGVQVGDAWFKTCPLPLLRDEEVIQQQPDQTSLTERYTEECVRFLREQRDGPFFLYMAHMHVHVPNYAPAHCMEASRNGRYGAAVLNLDWATGAVMFELAQLGLDENTLVIFTSDNGSNIWAGGSNAPLRGWKGDCWEGGMREPCLMRWPGVIEAGTVCDEMVASIDLLPTLAALSGGHVAEDRRIDGLDCSALLTGAEADSPREEFAYYGGSSLSAVRRGRWKLVLIGSELPPGEKRRRRPFSCTQLYDLKADIGEATDLAAQHPDVVAELQALAERFRADLGDSHCEVEGAGRRPIGRVDNPQTLCELDESHPYIIAEYDLPDRG